MPDQNTPANPANPAPVVVDPKAAPVVDPKAAPAADPANPNPAPVDPKAAPTDPKATPADPKGTADPEDPEKGYWPEDWRQKYAKGDAKLLKRLERFASPAAAIDAWIAAQAKISSGALKEPLKADASPEELAAWRAENGVPETPDKYELQLTDGLIVGEADKPFVDDFLKTAHGKNMDAGTVSAAVNWFLSKQEEAVAARAEKDATIRAQCFDQLREEFGPQYKNEIKIAMAALDNAPPGVKDAFLAGRLAAEAMSQSSMGQS